MGGNQMSLTASAAAIVDSGTSLLVGPDQEVQALMAMLGATRQGNSFVVMCEAKLPSISIVLGGRDCWVDFEDLVIERVAGFYCILGIQSLKNLGYWILGDVFMRKYYVQFDWGRKRLGLANATGAKNDNFV